jgi:hypothetical protein
MTREKSAGMNYSTRAAAAAAAGSAERPDRTQLGLCATIELQKRDLEVVPAHRVYDVMPSSTFVSVLEGSDGWGVATAV